MDASDTSPLARAPSILSRTLLCSEQPFLPRLQRLERLLKAHSRKQSFRRRWRLCEIRRDNSVIEAHENHKNSRDGQPNARCISLPGEILLERFHPDKQRQDGRRSCDHAQPIDAPRDLGLRRTRLLVCEFALKLCRRLIRIRFHGAGSMFERTRTRRYPPSTSLSTSSVT